MSDTVVDSSVIAKLFLPERDSAAAKVAVDAIRDAAAQVIVLDLALVEVANSIWKRFHRKMMVLDEAHSALEVLLQFPVKIQPAAPFLQPALEIAARYDRSVYDALFVALTRALNVRGVTADEPLFNAVQSDFPEVVLLRDWK